MNAANLAYLMRYVLAGIVLLATILLMRRALQEFSGGMRRSIKPTPGYFLIIPSRPGRPEDHMRSLPLFHTTIIGRHKNCDIRIKNDNVGKRHATIYLYDGDWYIEPLKLSHEVMIQGVPIRQATPLRNGDKLTFGGVRGITLIFIDERESSARQGLIYEVPLAEYREELQRRPVSSPWAWLLINLFAVCGGLLLILQMQAELGVMRRPILLMLAAFFLIINLYQLVLPRIFRYSDRIVIAAVTQLIYIGILIQLRLTLLRPVVMEGAIEDHGGSILRAMVSLVIPQMGALAIGLVVLPIVMAIVARTRFLEIIYPACLVLTPLLLIITLIFGGGAETHGATLWLTLGNTSIQLTEFAKITYLIVLATFFKNPPQMRAQLFFGVWAAAVMFLIMLLPDLGMIMILLPVTLVVYVVMTSEYLTTLGILVAGSGVSVLAYLLFPHVRTRLSGWTTLWEEVNDYNRQIVYGLQAMSRGGLFGRGIGNGSPDGIPVVASDMVFTVLCEEFGLIVGLCVVAMFIIIWLRGTKNMIHVKDGFSSSMTLAVSTMFFFEAALVIGGCTGLIPLTGVTLPFISQGGSSLLAKLIMVGILLGLMARRTEMVVKR